MKRLLYALSLGLLLVVIGLVVASFTQIRSQARTSSRSIASQPTPTENQDQTAIPLPTALVAFPDIEHIPIYPGASVTQLINTAPSHRYITYQVEDYLDKIRAFYQQQLPERDWLFRSSVNGRSLYTWSDPDGKSPWHLTLEVSVGLTLDDSKALVTLEYYRYPDVDQGTPPFPGAQQVQVTHSETTTHMPYEDLPTHVIDKTYISTAGPQQIANFYNATLLEYGWRFFDLSGQGNEASQTGDINSPDGLFFKAAHLGWQMESIVSYDLHITATLQKDGGTLVKLHIEEVEFAD